MKTISSKILKLLGWKIIGEFPDIKKSIGIFAPHTSYMDALIGKLYINELGINHKFISKKELFVFPGTFLMNKFGSIPVDTKNGRTIILSVASQLKKSEELHIVISPEGKFAKTTKWQKGFFYMAKRGKVPIVVSSIDYEKKEIGIKGVIYDVSDIDLVMKQVNKMYEGVIGKHPENFELETITEKK